ncbi:MAG: tRNA (guanine(46)-N(7))-methyltransferase TrmB [Pseudomonadales bacterium]
MSRANSQVVLSNQSGVHPALRRVVERHLDRHSNKPITQHTRDAFLHLQQCISLNKLPLILDAGCGNGVSSARLAHAYPQHLIVGVDKSSHRLQSTARNLIPDNCILVRAELEDFWRLAVDHHWQLEKHFILYPNPWPKQRQLRRRWHGSAAFPLIPALGGALELRTNWHNYALEFAAALHYAGHKCAVTPLSVVEPLTPFEAKYQASGHSLWRCSVDLSVSLEG